MPTTIPHRELRNNSSEILRRVAEGESFEITNHGRVVAVLDPASRSGRSPGRAPRVRGTFSELELLTLDHPIQDTLDELRGDR